MGDERRDDVTRPRQASLRQRELIRGLVRVWRTGVDGDAAEVVGTGMLVGPQEILTCAHVVAAATGLSAESSNPPQQTVRLDLPAVAPLTWLEAHVTVWFARSPRPDGAYDIAGLRLAAPAPAGALVVPLVLADGSWERSVRVFGFPAGRPDGSYASGSLRDVLANGWVLLRGGAEAREFVRSGYSGGPVYDDAGVLGMLTESDRAARVREAVMIPTETLLTVWPALAYSNRTCPYPGLAPFAPADADVFHGRREVAAELLRALCRPPSLVVLAGASGSGKSSLLQAGIAQVAGERWHDLRLTPGDRPYEAFARAAVAALDSDAGQPVAPAAAVREVARWRAALEGGDLSIADALAGVVEQLPSGARCLVALDQCEALFAPSDWPVDDEQADRSSRVRPRRGGPETVLERSVARDDDRRDRTPVGRRAARFVGDLVTALDDPRLRGRVALLLAVRTDHLDALVRLPPLARRHAETPLVEYLGPVDDLREVIEGPLRASGLTRLEEGLCERLLSDVRGQANPLPLLAFTLRELWFRQRAGRLSHAAYDALGGVARALAGYAESVLQGVAHDRRDVVRQVLVQLAQPLEGGTFVHRSAPLRGFTAMERALVGHLADRRLVVIEAGPDGEPCAAVIHEALFEHWPTLAQWLAEAWAFRRWQEGLRVAMAQWRALGEDPAGLPRGAHLRHAEAQSLLHGQALTVEERAFVAQAVEQRAREQAAEHARSAVAARTQRRLIAFLASSLVVVGVLAALAAWGWDSARRAQAAARDRASLVAEANDRLAALALDLERSLGGATEALAAQLGARALLVERGQQGAAADPRLGLLLAAQAAHVQPGATSADALLRSLQYVPRFRARMAVTATAAAVHDDMVLLGDAQGALWRVDAATGDTLAGPLTAHTGHVRALAVSAAGGWLASAGDDGRVRLWDLASLVPLGAPLAGHSRPVRGLVTDATGQRLAGLGIDGTVIVWSVEQRGLEARWERGSASLPPALASASVSASVSTGAHAAPEGDARDQGITVALEPADDVWSALHDAWLRAATFAGDGAWLVVADVEGTVRTHHRDAGWAARNEVRLGVEVTSLVGAPGEAAAYVGVLDGRIGRIDLVDGRIAWLPLRVHAAPLVGLAVADAGRTVAALGLDGRLVLASSGDGARSSAPFSAVGPAPWFVHADGFGVVVGASDGSVTSWYREDPAPLASLVVRRDATVTALHVGAGGDVGDVWVGWHDGRLERIEVAGGRVVATLERAHDGDVTGLASWPEAGVLLSAGRDGLLVLRDAATLVPEGAPLWRHHESLWSITPAADDDSVWVAGVQGVARRWSPAQRTLLEELRPDGGGLLWSPAPHVHEAASGALRVTSFDQRLLVTRDGAVVWSVPGDHEARVYDVALDAVHRRLLMRVDGAVEVRAWDAFTLVARFEGPLAGRFGVDPTGRHLALEHRGVGVQLLDARTLRPVGVPLALEGGVNALAFSPDGTRLVVGSTAGEVVAFDVDPASWLARACHKAGRDLTPAEWAAVVGALQYEPACGAVAAAADRVP